VSDWALCHADAIEQRLRDLASSVDAVERLVRDGLARFRPCRRQSAKQAKFAQMLGVNAEYWADTELAVSLARGIGPRVLTAICSSLAINFEAWCHGLPDLFLWTFAADDSSSTIQTPRVRFCEVKGPGDSLSHQQKCWIDTLQLAGGDIEVAYVGSR
jgi:Fanconi-associated nuclease 1